MLFFSFWQLSHFDLSKEKWEEYNKSCMNAIVMNPAKVRLKLSVISGKTLTLKISHKSSTCHKPFLWTPALPDSYCKLQFVHACLQFISNEKEFCLFLWQQKPTALRVDDLQFCKDKDSLCKSKVGSCLIIERIISLVPRVFSFSYELASSVAICFVTVT